MILDALSRCGLIGRPVPMPLAINPVWNSVRECTQINVLLWLDIVRWNWRNDVPANSIAIKDRRRMRENNRMWWMVRFALSSISIRGYQWNWCLDMPKAIHRPRNPCCACDEAKYQLTFQGLWSKQTHPRDWPPGRTLTSSLSFSSIHFVILEHLLHWSDLIGAVHSQDYSGMLVRSREREHRAWSTSLSSLF